MFSYGKFSKEGSSIEMLPLKIIELEVDLIMSTSDFFNWEKPPVRFIGSGILNRSSLMRF